MSESNGTSRRPHGSFFCVDRGAWHRLHEARCATLKVYMLLASREMDESGTSKQSIEFICETLGIARSSVFRALDQLREMGMLEVESGMGRWNQSTYRLLRIPPSQEVSPMTPSPVEGSHQWDPNGPTHDTQTVPPMTPPYEKSNKKSNEKKKSDSLFDEFWKQYPTPQSGRKVGKQETKAAFLKLSFADQQLAIQAARNYAASDRGREYAKDPIRFFRNAWWHDWLEATPSSNGSVSHDFIPNAADLKDD